MNYRGRGIDAVAFWSRYVDFPNERFNEADVFSPKVVCPNPEHDTFKRHFQVNLQQPMVHCFAYCGISGSWEHAVCVIEGLYEKFKVEEASDERERRRRTERAHREARKVILRATATGRGRAKGAPISTPRPGNPPKSAKAVRPDDLAYERFLPAAALDYLSGRGISKSSVAEWELGWLPAERRLAIPAKDLDGRIRFLVKRSVHSQQNPKYLYTEGYPKTSLLFGACQIDLGLVHSDGLVLVEGSLDTILFHQHGLKITGGILGTGISDAQCRIIDSIARAAGRLPRITLAFDKDTAGIRNIEIAAGKLRKYPLYVMKYPKQKFDPAELSQEEAYRQVSRAVPAFQFINTNGLNVRRGKERSFG